MRPPKLTCQALFALHAGPSDDARANGILTAMVPLAIATELAEDLQLADGLDEDAAEGGEGVRVRRVVTATLCSAEVRSRSV